MYHCRSCGDEIGRVGDGESRHAQMSVRALDVRSIPEDMSEDANLLGLALGDPDILSDEHAIWPQTDRDQERAKQARVAAFKIAKEKLTPRQREVLETVELYGSQARAAHVLNITAQGIGNILKQIQKKLAKYGL